MQVCGGDGLVLEPLAELWPPDLAGSLLLQHLLHQWKQTSSHGAEAVGSRVWELCLRAQPD